MKCKEFQDRIVEVIYSDITDEELHQFNIHKNECPRCSLLFEEMQNTVHLMKKRELPEIDPTFSSELWSKIEPHLKQEKNKNLFKVLNFQRPVSIPSWAYGIAAVIFIVIGIFLGRIYFIPQYEKTFQSESTSQTYASGQDSLSIETLSFLRRSKNLLLGFVNTPFRDEQMSGLSQYQKISHNLLENAEVIYSRLNKPEQIQVKRLIDELRVILLQLANTEIKPGVPVVEIIRNSIDRKSIFLKINIEEIRATSSSVQVKEKEKNI